MVNGKHGHIMKPGECARTPNCILITGGPRSTPLGPPSMSQANFNRRLNAQQNALFQHQQAVAQESARRQREAEQRQRDFTNKQIARVNKISAEVHDRTKAEFARAAAATKARNQQADDNIARAARIREDERKKAQEKENEAIESAVKFTADFYKDVTEKFGDISGKTAKELAEAAKGKQLRNVDDALKAFDKYKDVINKKFSVKDREAIARALESLDKGALGKNLTKFSKGFGFVTDAIDVTNLIVEIKKGFETGEWKGAMLQAESIAVGKLASFVVAFSFGIMAATPLGILGFATLMAVTSALIDDQMMDNMNKFILNL